MPMLFIFREILASILGHAVFYCIEIAELALVYRFYSYVGKISLFPGQL